MEAVLDGPHLVPEAEPITATDLPNPSGGSTGDSDFELSDVFDPPTGWKLPNPAPAPNPVEVPPTSIQCARTIRNINSSPRKK